MQEEEEGKSPVSVEEQIVEQVEVPVERPGGSETYAGADVSSSSSNALSVSGSSAKAGHDANEYVATLTEGAVKGIARCSKSGHFRKSKIEIRCQAMKSWPLSTSYGKCL